MTMAESWERAKVLKAVRTETLSGLETGYIDPLLAELRSVARRFGLLAEGCRLSDNPELRGMAQALDLSAGMLDDLLEEALETSLRRAVEENAWADPRPMGENGQPDEPEESYR